MVLHAFWLAPRLTNQHVDVLAFWFPRWCYLGRSIADGQIPTWLPNQFGGVPFASDPQSGWLYLPVMVLFSVFSCARALGLFIVLQPILAGLGMYWFSRNEGLGRAAATVGGLTMALAMSGSFTALQLPFAGMLAWTALCLAGVSGYLRSRTPLRVLGWLAFAAFSWSQIAAAHLTDGVLIGTGIVVLYLIARSVAQVRAGERTPRAATLLGAGLLLALPLLAAAVFVPRLALIPRTSIGHGYLELSRLASDLSGAPPPPVLHNHGIGPWWGTSFARGPSGYVGALGILLIPAALASRRWRLPASAFAVAALAGYVLNLDLLVSSSPVRALALRLPLGELWLRSPERFRYPLILSFAALAAYGLQAWFDMRPVAERRPAFRRLLWLLPALVIFVALPLVAGSWAARYLPFAAGVAYSVPLLLVAASPSPRRLWAAAALPALLAVELTLTGLVSQTGGPPSPPTDIFPPPANAGLGQSFPRMYRPSISPADYLTPGPIGRTLMSDDYGRYLAFDPDISRGTLRGFLFRQGRETWPAYENGRSILFGLHEVQGYSPVQLDRYWRLVRKVARSPIFYNSATFQSVRPPVLRLFGVRWLILPTKLPPPSGGWLAAREGSYSLYRLADADPRASVVFRWRKMPAAPALSAVLRPGFDPSTEAVVEEDPELGGHAVTPRPGPRASTSYKELTPQRAQVRVMTNSPGLLVVRNAYDPNWHATVDGRPANVMIADYLMQGIPVPAGNHLVELTYEDDMIGVGLAVSAISWTGFLALAAWHWIRRRAASPSGSPAT